MRMLLVFFDDISIKIKIWALSLIPLVAFLVTCVFLVYQNFNEFQDAKEADNRLTLMAKLHTVIGNLQIERATSNNFLDAKVSKENLDAVRKVTDKAVDEYCKELVEVKLSKDEVFKNVKLDLDTLTKFRDQVDNKIDHGTHITNFSNLIEKVLKNYMEVEKYAGQFGVSKILATISSLEDAKEAQDILRENMISMLIKGMPVDLDQQDRIIALKNSVDAYLNGNFMDLSTPSGQLLLKRDSVEYWGTADFVYGTLLNASTETKGKFDEDPTKIHLVLTSCVDDINKAILECLDIVGKELVDHREVAFKSFWRLLTITIILLLIIGIMIAMTTTNISRAVTKILDFVTSIGQGQLDETLDIHSKNELGMIGNQLRFTASGLKEANMRNEKIVRNLRNLAAPVFEVDKEFNLTFINKKAADFVGKASIECMGKKCFDVFKTDDCHTERCCCDRTMKSGVQEESATITINKDSEKIPVNYFATTVKDDIGNISGALGFVVDMAQVYGVAKQLQQAAISMGKIASDTTSSAVRLEDSSKSLNMQAASTSGSVKNITASMSNVSEKTARSNSEVATIATGAEEMKASMDSVSASIKMLSDSFGEIVSSSQGASEVTDRAGKESDGVSTSMAELRSGVESIGTFVEVITGIAEQTNLLALNATIEAARAGDAGKGFAVVANEVKELSKQTTISSEDIAGKIEDIQSSSAASSEKISLIVNIMKDIQEKNRAVSSTVEIQSGVTQEIAASVTDAAMAVGEVAKSIDAVRKSVEEISSSVSEVSRDMQEISKSSHEVAAASSSVAKDTKGLLEVAQRVTKLRDEFERVVKQFGLLDRL